MKSSIVTKKPESEITSTDIEEVSTTKPVFVFSRHCWYENVSYNPGDTITDPALIEKIMQDNVLSRKGQLNFI